MTIPKFENAFRNHDTLRRLARHHSLADRLVFVFFDPWTLLTQTAEPLLRAICAHGFSVASLRCCRLEEGDVEQIYRKNLPIRPDNAWHLPRQVYLMGVSLGLLLYHCDAKATDLLSRIKGKANPAVNARGHLRYDFRAPNRSLSLMHSSDTWEDTLHEALVFFGPHVLEHALEQIERQPPVGAVPAPSWDLGLEVIRRSSPSSLLVRVRLRAAAALRRVSSAHSPEVLRALDSLTCLWNEHVAADDASSPVIEAMRAYLGLVQSERPLLRGLLDCSPSTYTLEYQRLYHRAEDPAADLLRLLSVLNRPEEYVHVNTEALLRSIGVLRDRWEELLFKTTLFNFDDYLS